MCANCVTNAEAVLVSAIGAGNVAVSMAQRAADLVSGRSGSQRRLAAYRANADFLRAMGHDPALVLGPPPPLQPSRSRVLVARPGALLAT